MGMALPPSAQKGFFWAHMPGSTVQTPARQAWLWGLVVPGRAPLWGKAGRNSQNTLLHVNWHCLYSQAASSALGSAWPKANKRGTPAPQRPVHVSPLPLYVIFFGFSLSHPKTRQRQSLPGTLRVLVAHLICMQDGEAASFFPMPSDQVNTHGTPVSPGGPGIWSCFSYRAMSGICLLLLLSWSSSLCSCCGLFKCVIFFLAVV